MATGGVKGQSDYIDQVLSCQICLNPLVNRKARILSCLHTFCEACLENILSRQPGKQITCSICRQRTELQHGLVSDLPLNFNIEQAQRMAEVMTQTALCSKCCKKKEYIAATQICITCRRHMCDPCKKQHDRFPGFSAHQVQQLEHKLPGSSERLCNAHNSPVCLFCKKCKALLCSQCLTEETHDSHPDDIMTVDHALSDMQTLLLDKKGAVVKQLEFVREKIEVKTRQLEHLAGVEKDIIQKIDFLKSCIDKSGNDLLKELKENYIAKIQREKAHLTDILNRGKSSLKALEGFELDKTIRILDNSDSWIQDTSEFEKLLSGLNNEVETAMVKFTKQLQVSVIGKLEKTDLPPLVREPDRRDLLTPDDLIKLSKQLGQAAAKPTLVKTYKMSGFSVNRYSDVANLNDGSAVFIGEANDEILRINHQGDILSRYKPDGGDKIKSISAFNKTIICTFYGKSEFLELALVVNNITLTKIHSAHGIKADGVCVDCSGNIILYDQKTVTKLDSRNNIVWQKTVAETCSRVRSGLLDNKQCYLVNYYSAKKTDIWNEAGEVIGRLRYPPHHHPLVVRDMTVSHRGTFIATHRCTTSLVLDECITVTEYAPDGSFIRHLLTPKDGVLSPYRVSCDQQGYMWTTDTSLKIQTTFIYKLYL